MSSQDFAFLDPEQHRLARELQVLGLEYLIRSAEVPKSRIHQRSSTSELQQLRSHALHPALLTPSSPSVRVSRLFSDGSIYPALFNPQTDPLRLSRAVEITSRVDALLDEMERETDGVQAGVAVHGRRVVAHLVARRIGDASLKDPDVDMSSELTDLTAEVTGYVEELVSVFPANAYPGNVFKNQARVVQLLKDAGLSS